MNWPKVGKSQNLKILLTGPNNPRYGSVFNGRLDPKLNIIFNRILEPNLIYAEHFRFFNEPEEKLFKKMFLTGHKIPNSQISSP
jgi:hypothetical protein